MRSCPANLRVNRTQRARPRCFFGVHPALQGQNHNVPTVPSWLESKRNVYSAFLLIFFPIVMSIQLFGKTLHIYMFTKYFRTLYLFGCYPPDSCGRHAIIMALSTSFARLRTRGLSKVTLARACGASESQNQHWGSRSLTYVSRFLLCLGGSGDHVVTSASFHARERDLCRAPGCHICHTSHSSLGYILPFLPSLPANDPSHQKTHRNLLWTNTILTHPLCSLESIGAVSPLLICLIPSHSACPLCSLDISYAIYLSFGLCPLSPWVSTLQYTPSTTQPKVNQMFFILEGIS